MIYDTNNDIYAFYVIRIILLTSCWHCTKWRTLIMEQSKNNSYYFAEISILNYIYAKSNYQEVLMGCYINVFV